MLNIKKIIREAIEKALLQERLSGIVYHFMSLNAAYKMLYDNTFYLQSEYGGTGADRFNSKSPFYMSLTRQRDGRLGYSHTRKVRITFDGDMLNQRFKGKAIDYWSSGMGKQYYMSSPHVDYRGNKKYDQFQTRTENEDRLFSKEPVINDINQYIKRVDVLINADNEDECLYAYKILRNFNVAAQKIFIYGDKKSFNSLKGKTINNFINDKGSDYFEKSVTQNTYRNSNQQLASTIGKILMFILMTDDEIPKDKYKEEGAKLLRHYHLEKLIKPILNSMNFRWTTINDLEPSQDILALHNEAEDKEIYALTARMLRDYLQYHGYKNTDEARKAFEKRWQDKRNSYKKIDYEKEVPFMIWYDNHGNSGKIITNPNDSFANVIDNLWRYDVKYYFIDDIMNAIRSHNSKNDEYFKKYLQHLLKKNLSFMEMIKILKKMDIDWDYVKENILGGDVKIENLKYSDTWNYSVDNYDDRENYIDKLFQKR